MSKKKKNKWKYFDNKKSKKSGKKGRKSVYDKPKTKSVKPTLGKKEAKENKKILLAPVEIPSEFRKNRNKCNHAARTISVQEFKAMTPAYSAYTPMLEDVVGLFGEENVSVCKDCYDVLVDRSCVTFEQAHNSLVTLYAAVNVAVSNKKLGDGEVKRLNKLKALVEDFQPVLEIISKVVDDSPKDDVDDVSALNSTGVFVDPN